MTTADIFTEFNISVSFIAHYCTVSLMVEELITFIVQYTDILWLKGLEFSTSILYDYNNCNYLRFTVCTVL